MEGKNLLSKDEIEILITSIFPNEKAQIIATKLEICSFIHNNELYMLQKNLTYTREPQIKQYLVTSVTNLLELSFKNLSKQDQEIIKLKYNNKNDSYVKIFQNSNVNMYIDELYTKLNKSNIILDTTIGEIHFNNGYIDLKDLKFKLRNIDKHFITEYIKYDYYPSTTTEQGEILKIVKQIYPQDDDRECILFILGSALSGESTKDQTTLFLLGCGSSGKSVIMKMTKEATQCYFKELQSDTFSQSNTNIVKILNTFKKSPMIRFTWINEMDSKRMNESLFKELCEGDCKTTSLYADGQNNFKHYMKVIVTANVMPNFQIDSGVVRRFRGYTHNSLFIDENDKVNSKENIYLKNENLVQEIKEKKLLCAWFDILAKFANMWIKGKKPKFTQNFKETKDSVVSSNDIVQDFIDSELVITQEVNNRIGKNAMHKKFTSKFPDKHLSVLQVISSLKDHKICYNGTFRTDGIRGCFTCVKFKEIDDDEEYNNGVDKSNKSVPLVLQSEYVCKLDFQKIEEENAKLRNEIKQLKEQKDKKVKITTKEEIKSIEDLVNLQHLYNVTKQRTLKSVRKYSEYIKYLDWEFNGKFAKSINDDDTLFQEDEINLIF